MRLLGGQVQGLLSLLLPLCSPSRRGGVPPPSPAPVLSEPIPRTFLFLQGNAGRVGQSDPLGPAAPSRRGLTPGEGGPFPPGRLQFPRPSRLDPSRCLGLSARLLLTWGLHVFSLLSPPLALTPGPLPSQILL